MDLLARVVAWLNAGANVLGRWTLAPLGALPGWLSATLVSAVTGVLLLLVFKYTSNQRAIKRVRSDIQANLLTLKLFKDSAVVALKAQGRLLVGAGQLLVLAILPMLVMLVPATLLLGQLALWYQAKPLRVGEDAIVTLKLNDAEALTLWLDGRLVEASDRLSVSLTRGIHTLHVCVDLRKRQSTHLTCTIAETPNSAAQAQFVGAK